MVDHSEDLPTVANVLEELSRVLLGIDQGVPSGGGPCLSTSGRSAAVADHLPGTQPNFERELHLART